MQAQEQFRKFFCSAQQRENYWIGATSQNVADLDGIYQGDEFAKIIEQAKS